MAEQPPGEVRERITRAVRESAASDEGRVMKVLFFDDAGNPVGDWASSQLPEDPFAGYGSGLREPPYKLEQLVFLAESHPVHSAALEQKTTDIVGKGWEWEAIKKDAASEDERDALEEWFESLSPDEIDMRELLHQVWLDVETVAWGCLEVVRDPQGKVRNLHHVPGHTVRAHRNGFALCQMRDARKVWFRRWGCPDIDRKPVKVDAKTGSIRAVRTEANDMIVIKRPSQRSTWYGIPGYVSAIGWISLALAARDDNLMFFSNRREPRWAIILSNLADDPDIEEDLRRAFTVDLRQPYRNIIIPITGPGKIDFQKLTDNRQEGSFDRLSERADKAIMIGHRVPAERLANAEVGPLGGHRTEAASRVYKESVVSPGQELLASRLNRFNRIEYERESGKPPTWVLGLADLDIETDREELDLVAISFHGDLITLREARHRLKLPPLTVQERDADGNPVGEPVESKYNDMLFSELPGAAGTAGSPAGHVPGTGSLAQSREDLADLRRDVRTLYLTAREQSDQVAELLEAATPNPTG